MDLATAFELGLVLPEGVTRHDFARELAIALSGRVEPIEQIGTVSLPPVASGEIAALVFDVAQHHGAELESIASDFLCFYLRHRAARIVSGERWLMSVLHDSTLVGGERVAAVVTRPLVRSELDEIRTITRIASDLVATTPDPAVLRVHLDGVGFRDARAFDRLMELYLRFESEIVHLVDRPASGGGGPSRRDEALMTTVEIDVARSTLEAERILGIRELYVAMAGWALGGEPLPASLEDLGLTEWVRR